MQSIIQYLLPLKREIANASGSLNDSNGFSKGMYLLTISLWQPQTEKLMIKS